MASSHEVMVGGAGGAVAAAAAGAREEVVRVHNSPEPWRAIDTAVEERTPVGASIGGGFEGFKTGAGRAVTVSALTMEKARGLLDFDKPVGEEGAAPLEGPEAAAAATAPIGTGAAQSTGVAGGGGFAASLFSTGSGAPVAVSELAMNRGRRFFSAGIDTTDKTAEAAGAAGAEHSTPAMVPHSSDGGFGGFTTGGGKKVEVSDAGMQRAKTMFNFGDDTAQKGAAAATAAAARGGSRLAAGSQQRRWREALSSPPSGWTRWNFTPVVCTTPSAACGC
uniref:Uncharacterized protein n=1 Tax=Mantoniella antarctica TaxID=81844 RepID=A0A7S0SPP4_9CHLO